MRCVAVVLLASGVAGCVTTETVSFKPKAHQQGLVRDGQAALVSRLKNSIVLVRPARKVAFGHDGIMRGIVNVGCI